MQKLPRLKPCRNLAAAAAILALAACNTVGGAGRDVSATGNAVTNGASAATPR